MILCCGTFEATAKYANEQCGVDSHALVEAVKESARALYATYDFFPFTQMIGINPFEGLWGNFTGGTQEMFRSMERTVPTYRAASWTEGLAKLGVDDAILGHELGERFATERRSRPYRYEETLEVLETLSKKYTLLMLTNGSPDLQNEKLTMSPEIVPFFTNIVISGHFGQGKPSVELFQHALDSVGVTKDEAIMVGDKLTTDILGSNRIGMQSVWINHHGKTREATDAVPTHEIPRLRDLLELV